MCPFQEIWRLLFGGNFQMWSKSLKRILLLKNTYLYLPAIGSAAGGGSTSIMADLVSSRSGSNVDLEFFVSSEGDSWNFDALPFEIG